MVRPPIQVPNPMPTLKIPEKMDMADGQHPFPLRRRQLPQGEHQDQADEAQADDAVAVVIVKMRENIAAQEAADAEEHERRRNAVSTELRYQLQERFDIAVNGKIGRRKQDGDQVDADDEGIF